MVGAVEEVRRSYDAVAERYATEISSELDDKPLDRALLHVVAELAGDGAVADIGAGPGHVAGHLAQLDVRALAVDLSLKMCLVARRVSALPAVAADMTAIPLAESCLAGVVCLYAVIHLDAEARATAYSEFARTLRPGGHLLVSFHVSDDECAPGGERSLREWWGHRVHLVFRFLDPDQERVALERAGLEFIARMDRAPHSGVEHPSHRTYLLFRRRSGEPRPPLT